MAVRIRRPPAPRLDEGSKSYYKRVEGFLDEEEGGEGDIFLKNVVDQVIVDGVRLVSCDKDGSRALERLLQHHSVDCHSAKKLMKAVEPDFFKICVNRCGSHVMQGLVHLASHTLLTQHPEDPVLLQLLSSFMATVLEKVSDYIRHPYASHVLGGVVQDLGGVWLGERVGRSRYSQEFRKAKMVGVGVRRPSSSAVPEWSLKLLDEIARKIIKLAALKDLLVHQNGSPVLQSLLHVLTLQMPKRGEKLTKKILKLSRVLGAEEGALPEMFTDLIGSHLMEAMIETASQDMQQLIFGTCFKGRVMTSALHPVANFPLQHLISAVQPPLLTEIISEVASLEDILFLGHTGVVVKLAEAAVACPEVQPGLLAAILKAFHTSDHPSCSAPVILALLTYEVFYNDGGADGGSEPHPFTLHGSLLLQALLKFQDVKHVSRSVLKLGSAELMRVSCDPQASHVITAYLNSVTVPAKRKEKLIAKLVENLVLLCKDKHGSRVVDVVWRRCQVDRKEGIAALLLANEEELSADFHGGIVLRNCDIAHFRKKQAGWLEGQKAASKRRELFEDILGEGSGPGVVAGSGKKRKRSDVTKTETGDSDVETVATRKRGKHK